MANFSLICPGKIYSISSMAKNTFIHMACFSLICHAKIYYILPRQKYFYAHGNFYFGFPMTIFTLFFLPWWNYLISTDGIIKECEFMQVYWAQPTCLVEEAPVMHTSTRKKMSFVSKKRWADWKATDIHSFHVVEQSCFPNCDCWNNTKNTKIKQAACSS